MKYRVVELTDGSYQCQYRVWCFWWENSAHYRSGDLEEQKAFAERHSKTQRPKTRRVVYP